MADTRALRRSFFTPRRMSARAARTSSFCVPSMLTDRRIAATRSWAIRPSTSVVHELLHSVLVLVSNLDFRDFDADPTGAAECGAAVGRASNDLEVHLLLALRNLAFAVAERAAGGGLRRLLDVVEDRGHTITGLEVGIHAIIFRDELLFAFAEDLARKFGSPDHFVGGRRAQPACGRPVYSEPSLLSRRLASSIGRLQLQGIFRRSEGAYHATRGGPATLAMTSASEPADEALREPLRSPGR